MSVDINGRTVLTYAPTPQGQRARGRADQIQATDPVSADALRLAADDIDAARYHAKAALKGEPRWRTLLRAEWGREEYPGRHEILLGICNEVTELVRSTMRHGRPWRSETRTKMIGNLVGILWAHVVAVVLRDGAAPFDDTYEGARMPPIVTAAFELEMLMAQQVVEDDMHAIQAEAARRANGST